MAKKQKLYDFIVPAYWMVTGSIRIKAPDLDDAISIAGKTDLSKYETSYMSDSFEIDRDVIDDHLQNRISKDLIKVDNTPKKMLPLLIGQLETNHGKEALNKRLKGVL